MRDPNPIMTRSEADLLGGKIAEEHLPGAPDAVRRLQDESSSSSSASDDRMITGTDAELHPGKCGEPPGDSD